MMQENYLKKNLYANMKLKQQGATYELSDERGIVCEPYFDASVLIKAYKNYIECASNPASTKEQIQESWLNLGLAQKYAPVKFRYEISNRNQLPAYHLLLPGSLSKTLTLYDPEYKNQPHFKRHNKWIRY